MGIGMATLLLSGYTALITYPVEKGERNYTPAFCDFRRRPLVRLACDQCS